MKKSKLFSLLAAGAMLVILSVGCYYQHVYEYEKLDLSQKTILIPHNRSMFSAYRVIRQTLRKNGWNILLEEDSLRINDIKNPNKEAPALARYRLTFYGRPVDFLLLDGTPIYVFEILIIDTKTKKEIIGINGKDIEYRIGNKLDELLQDLEKNGSSETR